MDAVNGGVVIVNENPGKLSQEWVVGILCALQADRARVMDGEEQLIAGISPHKGGAGIAMFRNMAVERFLTQSRGEALLFLDSDIQIDKTTIPILWEALDPVERPVVSGLYFSPLDEGIRPVVYSRREPDENNRVYRTPYETFPEDTLWGPVDSVGAGCLMIHRSLLEAMLNVYGEPTPWFAEEIIDGVQCGEDFSFCERVHQMGFPVYVHTAAHVSHVCNITLNKALMDRTARITAALPEEART